MRLVRRVLCVAVGFIVLVGGMVVAPTFFVVRPALASTGTVTAPAAPTFSLSTASQDPGDFVLSGFASDATLLVSIGFVDPPSGTTFALPTTTGLTAGYGYNFSGNKVQISFTGSQTNANTALAAMTVGTGATNGTVTIRVTASVNAANVYYNPINDHFYEYVSTSATTDCYSGSGATCVTNIENAIASRTTLFGAKGYWVTITSSAENSFVADNMNASNIAIGLTDRDVEQGSSRTGWKYAMGPEKGTTASYVAAWASGEPNDYSSGEDYVVTNWGGGRGSWNDYGRPLSGASLAYVVEYSTDCISLNDAGSCVSGSYSGSNYSSATVSAIVDNAPKNVTAARATPVVSGSLNVSWTAPATGTVTSYTATSTPGSLTCTSATTSCTVTGLTNGTSYTFTVTATFNDSTTKTSTASAAAIPDDGTTPTVTVTTARIRAAASATVRSTKTGTAYLVKDTVTVTNKASITDAADSQWNQVSITAANTDTSLAATGLVEGTYKAYAVDAVDNLSAVSTGTVTVDSTAPTSATLAASTTTSSSATITFTVTGSEDLDCTTLSTTADTDFTLTRISAISSIAQTSGTVCTITATSTATAGGGAVTSTLTAAASFSVSDTAGNALTTLTGSPQSITVTVPAGTPTPATASECEKHNHAFDSCPLWPGRTTTTTVSAGGSGTAVTTTTVATITTAPTTPTTAPTSPRVTIPNVETPKKVVVLTSSSAVDPTRLVADAAKDFASEGDVAVAAKMRAALISVAPTIGTAIAEATVRLATVLEDRTSTKLEIVKAKAAVADAVSLTILEALKVANGNVTSLALPITKGKELPEVEPGKALIITPSGNAPAQTKIVNETTMVMSSPKENLLLAMSAIDPGGEPAKVSETGSIVAVTGQSLAVTGTGFRPNSPVKVWMFSNPRNFGTVTTDAKGSFAAEVPMPDNLAPGDHTAQVNGQNALGGTRSMNMGLEVALEKPTVKRPNQPTRSTDKSFTSRVYFKVQSAILTKATQKQLVSIAKRFAGTPSVSVKCVGYTQLGIRSDRYELAEDRAKAACARLKKLGLNADYRAVGKGRALDGRKVSSGTARLVVITVKHSQSKSP